MAIRKTKTGYQVQWYDADGRFRKRTFRGVTRDQAVKLERDMLARRDRGEPEIDRRLAPTFRVFATTWLDEHGTGWKASTRKQYAHAIDRWLAPAVGEVRVCDLTEPQVRRLLADLQAHELSPKRINFVVLVLRMLVRTAVRRRLLRDDPCAGVRPLREPRTDVDPFAPEEVSTFLAACPSHWRPYFTVAFWTGARPGELAALKWGDVDFGRGSFRIRAGRYRGVEGSPKTESSNATSTCWHRYRTPCRRSAHSRRRRGSPTAVVSPRRGGTTCSRCQAVGVSIRTGCENTSGTAP
jgi:integrase